MVVVRWFDEFFVKFELCMKIWIFCDKISWKTRQINDEDSNSEAKNHNINPVGFAELEAASFRFDWLVR